MQDNPVGGEGRKEEREADKATPCARTWPGLSIQHRQLVGSPARAWLPGLSHLDARDI